MRVLVTSPVFPPDLGGPAVYVPNVARFLVERGHTVKVIAFCSDPAPAGYSFEVESIGAALLPLRYLKAFWRVFRTAGQFDVVFVNEHLALLHVLAARLRGKPVVIRIMVDGAWEIAHRKGWCDGDGIVAFQTRRYGFRVRLTRALQRRWWRSASKIIACSEFLRGILVDSYGVPGAKVERIFNAYHGPDPESVGDTKAEARVALGLDPAPRYLLTICRLMVWKRVDNVIRALDELPEDVELLIAGVGDMEAAWRALALELGLEARVHFLGNLPHERIPLAIRAAEIFVLNSEYEGLSHTLLEVLNLGTPIVASRVCGNPEVVEDGVSGLLVDPTEPSEVAMAVRKLLENRSLARSLAEAAKAGRARFDRDETFGRVAETLERAAAQS